MPTCDMLLQITALIGCFCCFFLDKTIPKDGDTVSVHYTGKKYAERVGRVTGKKYTDLAGPTSEKE